MTTAASTARVSLKVGGRVFGPWTEVEIVRDLSDISGSFRLSYYDEARAGRALRPNTSAVGLMELKPGQEARVEIDGELVLLGWIDDVDLEWGPDRLSASVVGRDRTGDLVDCAATVDGPAEYTAITLEELVRRIAAPFGIPVRSEVGPGRRFERFSIDVAETAMAAMEKATRQAAVLLTSDGVGGLVLTKSGVRRAPEALRLPGNVSLGRAKFSWRQRYSDYIYKAQGGTGGGTARLDHTANPLTGIPAAPANPAATATARAVLRSGRARDAEVTRYRPRVRLVRTESQGSSAQEQADWLMRVARGESEGLTYEWPADWRAGASQGRPGRLWRPNELAAVVDPYAGVDRDMLISAVTYRYDSQGTRTEIRVVGPEAFDRIREDARRRIVTRAVEDTRGRSTATPLGPAAPTPRGTPPGGTPP